MRERRAKYAAGHDPYVCETCGKSYATYLEAWKDLTPSHVQPRNDTATRYERRREPEFRKDDPSNIVIECRACNQRREPQPQFGETA